MATTCKRCKNYPCVKSDKNDGKCPDFDKGKPRVYSHNKAETRIEELEAENRKLNWQMIKYKTVYESIKEGLCKYDDDQAQAFRHFVIGAYDIVEGE